MKSPSKKALVWIYFFWILLLGVFYTLIKKENQLDAEFTAHPFMELSSVKQELRSTLLYEHILGCFIFFAGIVSPFLIKKWHYSAFIVTALLTIIAYSR